MKCVTYALLAAAGVLAAPCASPAQDAKTAIPQFQVDALWPKPLPNGEVRILDHGSKEILGRFGRVGRQAGQFTALHNITVDHQGNIYTAEVSTGQRIQKFRRLDLSEP